MQRLQALHPLRAALNLASPAGARARLSILVYHRVLPVADPLFPEAPDRHSFDWQMGMLARHFNVLPLAEAGRRLRDNTLPPRAACITFDDGYADNVTEALPILLRHGLPATFFIASGFLDGGRMFNDTLIEWVRRLPPGTLDLDGLGLGRHTIDDAASRRALIVQLIETCRYLPLHERLERVQAIVATHPLTLPDDLMLSSAQLRVLAHAEGISIGAHTRSHPILSRIDDAASRIEIERGKLDLERTVDVPIRLFAYPNGQPGRDYEARHVAMVQHAGFDLALSTRTAAASHTSDPWQLPRYAPDDGTPMRFALNMLRTTAQGNA